MPRPQTSAALTKQACRKSLARHAGREGPLLPILHDVQAALGFVPHEAIAILAEALNLTRAEVHGTVSFYHDFRTAPAGRRIVKLCQAEACQARGGRAVAVAAEARLGVSLGKTSADGAVTLEPVYCLGLCATAPSAMLDGRVVGRLDASRLDTLMAEAQR